MSGTERRRWLPAAAIVAFVYAAAGVGFAALAGSAGPGRLRVAWRLAAWLVSGAALAGQIAWEGVRLRLRPRATAWHAALAAAAGMFVLAVVANLHPHAAELNSRLRLSLLLWPLIGAVPAGLAALALARIGAAISATRPGRSESSSREGHE